MRLVGKMLFWKIVKSKRADVFFIRLVIADLIKGIAPGHDQGQAEQDQPGVQRQVQEIRD